MKLAVTMLALFFPILSQAAASTVSVPLAQQKDSSTGNLRACLYQTDLRLGNSEAMKPFQVFVQDEDGIYRQMNIALRKDDGGFFLKLFGYKEVAAGAACPSFIELLVVR